MPTNHKDRRLAHTAAIRILVNNQRPTCDDAQDRLAQRIERLLKIAETRAVYQDESQEDEVLTLFRTALERSRDR